MTPMAREPLRWTLSIALSLVCCLVLASPVLARGGGMGVGAGGGGRPGAGVEIQRGGGPQVGAQSPSCRGAAAGIVCVVSPFVGLALGATLFAWLASRGPATGLRERPRRRRRRRHRAPPNRRGARS